MAAHPVLSGAMRFPITLALVALLGACASLAGMRMTSGDRFLWLEDIEGERALTWVKAENARSPAVLQGDQRFEPAQAQALSILNSKDRLALGTIRAGNVYNFWQDEKNVRDLWRRSPLAPY